MEDTLLQIESVVKKFEEREQTTIFENEQLAVTIRSIAEDLKSVQGKLANNEILKKYYHAEEVRIFFEAKYRTLMDAINEIEGDLEVLRSKINDSPKAFESFRSKIEESLELEENEHFYEFRRWSQENSFGMVPAEEYNEMKQRLEMIERENEILSNDNRENEKAVQELEKVVSDYRFRVTRLLSENSEFRRDLEQNHQIRQILSERKSDIDRKSKHCMDRMKFYELKNDTLEELNKSLYDHISGLEEELARIKEEKDELEEAFRRKMSELEDHMQAREQFFSILKNEVEGCYATLTPNKGNVIFVDRNENAVLRAKLKTPDRFVEKFPEEYDNMDFADFNFNMSKKKAIAGQSTSNRNEQQQDDSELPSPSHHRTDTFPLNENLMTLRKQADDSVVEGIIVRKLSLRENGHSFEAKEILMTKKRKSLESTLIIEKQQMEQYQRPPNRNHKKNCKVFMNSIKFKEALENINLNATSEDDIPTSRQHWFQTSGKQTGKENENENENIVNNLSTPVRKADCSSDKIGDYYTRDFNLSSVKRIPNSPREREKKQSKDLPAENEKVVGRACVGCHIF